MLSGGPASSDCRRVGKHVLNDTRLFSSSLPLCLTRQNVNPGGLAHSRRLKESDGPSELTTQVPCAGQQALALTATSDRCSCFIREALRRLRRTLCSTC